MRKQIKNSSILSVVLFGVFLVAVAWFIPNNVSASVPWNFSEDSIIPCGGGIDKNGEQQPRCESICDLTHLVKNIIEFIMTVAGSIAVINIIIGGVMYIIGPANIGDPNKKGTGGIDKAKRMLTYTVTGFVIVAIAWVIINTIVTVLGYNSGHPWYEIHCETPF